LILPYRKLGASLSAYDCERDVTCADYQYEIEKAQVRQHACPSQQDLR